MKIKLLILLISLGCVCEVSYSQFDINTSKYDTIPFKRDTAIGFPTRDIYQKVYALPVKDLTRSDAILEARIITPKIGGSFSVFILRYYSDSAILERYDRNPESQTQWTDLKRNLSMDEGRIILDDLIERGLFFSDINLEKSNEWKKLAVDSKYAKFVTAGKVNVGPISSSYPATFEIKFKDSYRTFLSKHASFYYLNNTNAMRDIVSVSEGNHLLTYTNTLFKLHLNLHP